MTTSIRLWAIWMLLLLCCQAGEAQQFRVYTRVLRVGIDQPEEKPEVIARSLTLFHAGKVYDLVPAAGEVTIFEPAHERFIVFSARQMLATTVTFDEIRRLLDSARDETRNYAERLKERRDRESLTVVEPLLFQLSPKFNEKYDETENRLTLKSPRFNYAVECQYPEIPEALESYLSYADWAARLNHVLHPHSLYPEPRLKLNNALREHQRIPSKVELQVAFDRPLHLQAEHRFDWSLSADDRQSISHWEGLMKKSDMKVVSFREYQRSVILGTAQAKR